MFSFILLAQSASASQSASPCKLKKKARVCASVMDERDMVEVEDARKRCKTQESVASFVRVKRGSVAVAKYFPGKPQVEMKDYRNVLIHTPGTPSIGTPLSPYVLRNESGFLLENVWQFSKFYASVASQNIPMSRYHPERVIWNHPAEVHRNEDTGEPTEAYWKWREKGMKNTYAVRYPNGFDGRHKCLYTIWPDRDRPNQLSYVEARKQVYCGAYARLAPKTDAFKQLATLVAEGVNLLILEVDGPDPTLRFEPYVRLSKESPGLIMDESVTRMLLDDTRKPFGHGYVIAALILGGAEWISSFCFCSVRARCALL